MPDEKPALAPRDGLPPGSMIDNYRVTRIIAKGGFSLIYLAVDDETGDEVVVKEYLPKKLARRGSRLNLIPIGVHLTEQLHQGRKLFFQEAKTLASLRHPNIVRVVGLFLANDTAYLVMQYERGKNLGSYIQERKGGLSTRFICQVFLPILDALAMIHSRCLLHLDVKPGNIHLRHGNDPVLLDFGAVHPLARGRSPTATVITAGYSPVEQYSRGGHVGPWTDVYAVGVSIRTCMAGTPPPPSMDRQSHDPMPPAQFVFRDRYPLSLLKIVDWAMEVDSDRRPQDAGELLRALRQFASEAPNLRFSELPPCPESPWGLTS